jgi:tetratricopeptide (TPR) repeat protein
VSRTGPKSAAQARFGRQRVEQLRGMSAALVQKLVGAGLVSPSRGPSQQLEFSFQELMLLRTAQALMEARVPSKRMLLALTKLRSELPAEMPLTGIRIAAVGAEVVVRDRSTQWEARSGQLLLDFDADAWQSEVQSFPIQSASDLSADELVERARALEETDAAAAETAYRQALAQDPAHVNAHLNFGAMLCDAGRCEEASALYTNAVALCPGEPTIHFNRAVVLEDLGQDAQALASYRQCLVCDATYADAHFNAARLLERLGDGQKALRHFNAYRRLQPR